MIDNNLYLYVLYQVTLNIDHLKTIPKFSINTIIFEVKLSVIKPLLLAIR